jgi:hypothetical protein
MIVGTGYGPAEAGHYFLPYVVSCLTGPFSSPYVVSGFSRTVLRAGLILTIRWLKPKPN